MADSMSLRARKVLIAGLWVAGLALAVSMLLGRPAGDVQGIAWVAPVDLVAPSSAELLDIATQLHAAVEAGQLVARMNPAALLAEKAVLEAELRALEFATVEEARTRRRRFQTDSESAALERARVQASVAEQESRLAALETEYAREQRLVTEGLQGRAVTEDLRAQAEVLRTRIAAERSWLDLTQDALDSATRREAGESGPNAFEVEVASRRLAEVELELSQLEIRTPISGQVTEVDGTPGEWIAAGTSLLRVSPTVTSTIDVWIRTRAALDTLPGDQATVRRASGERLRGDVVSVSVERQQMPAALWYRANTPEWGFLVRVALDSAVLRANEPVRVTLH